MSKFRSRTVAIATLAALGSSLLVSGAHAQTARKPGLLHRLFHRSTPMAGGGTSRMSGNVVGNKNTHVFHLPGDKGQLPEPKNRVYFRTAAEARAAGYHEAGHTTMRSHSSTGMMHSRSHMSTSHGLLHRTH